MFVLTQTASALKDNTDPRIGAVLFVLIIACIAILCGLVLSKLIIWVMQKVQERRRKQKEEAERTWRVVDKKG